VNDSIGNNVASREERHLPGMQKKTMKSPISIISLQTEI
jgi:hypothetical protein